MEDPGDELIKLRKSRKKDEKRRLLQGKYDKTKDALTPTISNTHYGYVNLENQTYVLEMDTGDESYVKIRIISNRLGLEVIIQTSVS